MAYASRSSLLMALLLFLIDGVHTRAFAQDSIQGALKKQGQTSQIERGNQLAADILLFPFQ